MKEALVSRVGRIISGSLNALVDAVENAAPEVVMEEAIREVDGAIDEVRSELGQVIATKHLASNRLMSENRKHEDLAEKIELAVNEGRDDLAETAIASQLDIEAQIPVLENTIAECSSQEKELEGYIEALLAKKREMKEELKQFKAARQATAPARAAGGGAGGDGVQSSVDKASETFDRVMENASGVGSHAGTAERRSAAQLAELEDMARNNRIQERLAKIKGDKQRGND